MKLTIYYDLETAIKNAREPFGPFKVIRNNRQKWGKLLPIYTGIDYIVQKNMVQVIPTLILQYSFLLSAEMISHKISGVDMYEYSSIEDLKKLVAQLEALHLSTSTVLLQKADVYEKNYHIQLNEKKIPSFMQEKYFLVPTYGFRGEIRDTSLQQEHEMGSKEYVLSIGSPIKAFRAVYSQANGGIV